jgi:hypothetical protein
MDLAPNAESNLRKYIAAWKDLTVIGHSPERIAGQSEV